MTEGTRTIVLVVASVVAIAASGCAAQPTAPTTAAALPTKQASLAPRAAADSPLQFVSVKTTKGAATGRPGWTRYSTSLAIENRSSDYIEVGQATGINVLTKEGQSYDGRLVTGANWAVLPPKTRLSAHWGPGAIGLFQFVAEYAIPDTLTPTRIDVPGIGTFALSEAPKLTFPFIESEPPDLGRLPATVQMPQGKISLGGTTVRGAGDFQSLNLPISITSNVVTADTTVSLKVITLLENGTEFLGWNGSQVHIGPLQTYTASISHYLPKQWQNMKRWVILGGDVKALLIADNDQDALMRSKLGAVKVVNTGGDGVLMRQKPSKASPVVVAVMEGKALQLMGEDVQAEGITWRNVGDAQGNVGWINSGYLDLTPIN